MPRAATKTHLKDNIPTYVMQFRQVYWYAHYDRIDLQSSREGQISAITSLFLNQNICCGYSKEASHRDVSFEHPQHMFRTSHKKIIKIYIFKNLVIPLMDVLFGSSQVSLTMNK